MNPGRIDDALKGGSTNDIAYQEMLQRVRGESDTSVRCPQLPADNPVFSVLSSPTRLWGATGCFGPHVAVLFDADVSYRVLGSFWSARFLTRLLMDVAQLI